MPPPNPDPSPPPDPAAHHPTPPADPYARREGVGHPSLLTAEVADRIVQVVRAGSYLAVAAAFAGVSESSLKAWLARGRRAAATVEAGEDLPAEEHRYLSFLTRVRQAEPEAEVAAATAWRAKVTDDWRAARDYLRYRHPDRWRAVTTVTLRPQEAEERIERAVWEALTALGIDAPQPGGTDSTTQALLDELTGDDEEPEP